MSKIVSCPECKTQVCGETKFNNGSDGLVVRFKDKIGRHTHDSNTVTATFRCENAHVFDVCYLHSCSIPGCTWTPNVVSDTPANVPSNRVSCTECKSVKCGEVTTATTERFVPKFTDSLGTHHHDTNMTTATFRCENGHYSSIQWSSACPLAKCTWLKKA